MENRSFDHFLGWLPGANGMQAGLSFMDTAGNTYPTYALTDYQGCGHADPDHSYSGGRVEYDGGKCDGFLKTAPVGDQFPIGYYGQSDLAFLGQAAPGWTTFSNYFAAIMAETFPNRIYQHAAQTDRIDNSTTISTLPTIWDRLPTIASAAAITSATSLCWHCGVQNTCQSARPSRSSLPIAPLAPCHMCRLWSRVF